MRISFQASATWGDKPLDKLVELMQKRMKVLRENAYDAAVATMINVLTSLRAQTRKAGARTAKASKPVLTRRADLRVSFDRKTMHRCIRIGERHDAPIFRPAERVRIIASRNNRTAPVFKVRPLHERDKAYYIAADSEADAINFERRRVGHRVRSFGGLAKLAFSIASNRISTRNATTGGISVFARAAAERFTKTSDRLRGTTLVLEARDLLEHAVPALNGGAAAIDRAYMAAANKTYGLLSRHVSKYGNDMFDSDCNIGSTPFPEAMRRR